MSQHNICHGLTVRVEKKGYKYHIVGLSYKQIKILENWESLAQVSMIATMFKQKELPKGYVYSVETLSFEHVERAKIHYLKLVIGEDTLFLSSLEVQLIPAIVNRVIARCDVLDRNSSFDIESDEYAEFKMFKEFPILVKCSIKENTDDN